PYAQILSSVRDVLGETRPGSANLEGQRREIALPVRFRPGGAPQVRSAEQPAARASNGKRGTPLTVRDFEDALRIPGADQADGKGGEGLTVSQHADRQLVAGTKRRQVLLRHDLQGHARRLGPRAVFSRLA